MTAIDWAARTALARPSMPLALEVRPTATVPASVPALPATTATLPEVPAKRLAGATSVRLPLADVARTSRLS